MTALYFSPPACREHDTGEPSRARGAHRRHRGAAGAGRLPRLRAPHRRARDRGAALRGPRRGVRGAGARGRRAGGGHDRRARLVRGRGGRRRRGVRAGGGAAGGRGARGLLRRAAARPPRPAGHDRRASACSTTSPSPPATRSTELGAARVLILDWDVHHGDGTHDLFRASDAVLFASIHQERIFPGTGPLHDVGARAGLGFSINLPVPKHSDEYDLGLAGGAHRRARGRGVRPGPDPRSPPATTPMPTTRRAAACSRPAPSPRWRATCARWASAPGRRSARCWRAATRSTPSPASVAATMAALAGDEPPDSIAPDYVTARAASHIGHHWTL